MNIWQICQAPGEFLLSTKTGKKKAVCAEHVPANVWHKESVPHTVIPLKLKKKPQTTSEPNDD